ncbi:MULTISPECIES: hypothetical protein [Sphingomonas]|uniref:hypothetical protein n=1 Tax=Sphingomonas TaxID=13687 RepID=UPI00105651F8|nr:hypothetical protein [Sphingomonas sp. PP-CE-1G-424]TCP71586.1 hypothetical protein C8J43_102667 [Sphingomonas sp. PP-CE-1G-424]
MAEKVIRIDRKTFRLVATVNEGGSLYFSAGAVIAVEKYDMRIGKSEFDFQVNSRRFRGRVPEPIAASQAGLDREFMESRVKSNLMGLPVSVGNAVAMARDRRIELTYGEVRPQVFRSSVPTQPVAWRIWFKQTWYSGQASGRSMLGKAKASDGLKASASAAGSAAIGGASGRSITTFAPNAIGPLTNDAGILRVYVPTEDPFTLFRRPFDSHDLIGRAPTLADHVGSFIRGRGW